MSCISSNFSSFFLNSLNDSSEFAKYLSNGELKFSSFEDFQAFGAGASASAAPSATHPQQQQQQQQQQQYYATTSNGNSSNSHLSAGANAAGLHSASELFNGGGHTESTASTAAAAAAGNYALQPPTAAAPSAAVPLAGAQQVTQPHPLPQHISHLRTHPSLHAHHPLHASQQQSPHAHHHAQHPYIHAPTSTFHHQQQHQQQQQHHHAAAHHPHATPQGYANTPQQSRWGSSMTAAPTIANTPGAASAHAMSQLHNSHQSGAPMAPHPAHPGGAQHFDGSFEFLKYLRHSNDYNGECGDVNPGSTGGGSAIGCHPQPQPSSSSSSLIDLDSSTKQKSRTSRKVAAMLSSVSRASNNLDANTLDVFDHDTKHTIFDLNHIGTHSSNSNESSLEVSNMAFPSSHLNASNSNTSSEGAATGNSDFAIQHSNSNSGAPKPLASFTIRENFDVHPSHKVEEGIFQHMNKLPSKKKDNLKQLGVRFTGQMTLADKSIVVDNFIKFCQEYDVKDHRPFLSLNQSGLNKPDQIKFARYLGQGLPTFTLFCIYSNFKNLFCTKRTEIYTKDGYNLPYILDKTKRFLSNTTAGNTPSKTNHNVPQTQSQQQQLQQLPPPPPTSQVTQTHQVPPQHQQKLSSQPKPKPQPQQQQQHSQLQPPARAPLQLESHVPMEMGL